MEYNIQKYQFHQNGKDYVVSTGLIGDRIRITCQENLSLDGPFYSNEFSLYDLRAANQFFRLSRTPEEALVEINKGIERQKSGLKPGINDTMHFLGYLVIGTDNDVYNLILRRDYEPNKYGIFTPPSSGAADLVLTTNYNVDGRRLIMSEQNSGNLQSQQTSIEEELNRTIPEVNKFKKITMDIEEENALIRERLKILQKQLEQRKYNIMKLIQENANLKRDNLNLNNYIKNAENSIRSKQVIQTTIKVPERPNINPGTSAVTSKFEQSALRTFLSRTGAKPSTEEYPHNMNYIIEPTPKINYSIVEPTRPPTHYINNTNIIEDKIETQYLPPIYQQPQVIQPQPIILKIEQPILNISPQKQLRNSNYSISSFNSYNNPTYRAYLSTPSNVEYKNRVNDPNYYRSMAKNKNNSKDVAYNSSLANTNKDIPYTSQMAQLNQNKIISIGNTLNKSNSTKNIKDTLNLQKYNSSMDKNNLKDTGYNSQMAKTQGNVNEGYHKPTGSRMPQAKLGNYSGPLFGSKTPNSSHKKKKTDSPDIGYSSYRPDIK